MGNRVKNVFIISVVFILISILVMSIPNNPAEVVGSHTEYWVDGTNGDDGNLGYKIKEFLGISEAKRVIASECPDKEFIYIENRNFIKQEVMTKQEDS